MGRPSINAFDPSTSTASAWNTVRVSIARRIAASAKPWPAASNAPNDTSNQSTRRITAKPYPQVC